ncbi:hypothetical protein [Streptacidiphilus sp. MAP5-3]|uniref:hypothetical protein n=1 Tax=unclassified Streptacidiphilus TaxID=2643834 RepID=UPI003513315F
MQQFVSPNTLDNPAVRAELEKRKESKLKEKRRYAAAYELLLQHCPWREFGYRLGRWERVQTWEFCGLRLVEWEKTDVLQLIDLGSGRAINEMYLDPQQLPFGSGVELPRPTGRVWLAGSPFSKAVLSLHGSELGLFQATASHLLREDPEELARQLLSGQERLPREPYQQVDRYGRSTWLADCPEKPRKQDGFTWRFRDMDRTDIGNMRQGGSWRRVGH